VRRPVEWAVAARHQEEGEGPSSGLAWAEVGRELRQVQKILGKMKRAAKIVWAENELGSIENFKYNSRF
jgi:hypothetical protein